MYRAGTRAVRVAPSTPHFPLAVCLCARLQLDFVDLTAMPLGGSVFMAALPAGYDDEWNKAIGDARCPLPNVTVCAYNSFGGQQVQCSWAGHVFGLRVFPYAMSVSLVCALVEFTLRIHNHACKHRPMDEPPMPAACAADCMREHAG